MLTEALRNYLIEQYVEQGRSTYQIAEACGTYPNRIRRALKHFNIERRSKSAAQSVAIKMGRHEHPTKGKKRSEAVKIRISEGMYHVWQKMDEAERSRRIELARAQWNAMTKEEQEEFRNLAAEAVRRAAEKGSKLEHFLLLSLQSQGYKVDFHKENLLSNEKLQIDLYLPDLNTAIEVDGPAHFLPIWGEENLEKHITADYAKSGLLITHGYAIIRIKHITRNLSEIHKRNLLSVVLDKLKSIKTNFPKLEDRLIEIEVK